MSDESNYQDYNADDVDDNESDVDAGSEAESGEEEALVNVTDKEGNTIPLRLEDIQSQFDKFYNDNSWKSANQKVSEANKKDMADFEANVRAQEARLAERQQKVVQAEQALQQKQQVQKAWSEADQKVWYGNALNSIADFKMKFADYDHERVTAFSKRFNLEDNFDRIGIFYLAERGAKLEQEIERAKAEMVLQSHGRGGLPPIGMKGQEEPAEGEADSIEEGAKKAVNFLKWWRKS
jgi:uncharacterized small protein (DUF1192 family)